MDVPPVVNPTPNTSNVVAMDGNTSGSKTKKPLYLFLALVFTLLTFSIGAFLGYTYSQNQNQSKETAITNNEITNDTEVTSPPELGADEKEYVSEKLGVKFTYSTITDTTYKWPVTITEEGNRIQFWVQPNGGERSESHFLDVFEKDPNDSFTDAIQKSVLANYNPDDCVITIIRGDLMNPNNQYASINVPNQTDLDLGQIYELAKKCPDYYTATNFVGFFYYNTLHKDKFMYFSLGQDGSTQLKNGKQWYQTVEFVD